MYRKKITQKICQAEDITNLINQRTNTPTYFISIIPRQIKRIVVIIYFLFFSVLITIRKWTEFEKNSKFCPKLIPKKIYYSPI